MYPPSSIYTHSRFSMFESVKESILVPWFTCWLHFYKICIIKPWEKKSYVLGFDNFFKQDFSFTWMADSRAARYGHVPFGCTTPGNNILYYTTQPTPACQLRIIVLVCLSLEVEILLCTFHLASSLYLKLISIFNFKSFVSLLFWGK